jgi:hypothetical protein
VLTGLRISGSFGSQNPPTLESATAATWLEMKARGHWLASADKFLVEIVATLMAR